MASETHRARAGSGKRSGVQRAKPSAASSTNGLIAPKRTRTALLRWFDANKRDLPWRGLRDPWAILVSEVMLQQTTVATVTPYWERFLELWPTPADLAAASRDELLSAWAGLGYYRRAHMLKEAAGHLAQGVPGDADGLRALPGIGEYTAAAVASIAFDEPVAAVDGNVERVVSRLAALEGDPRKAAGKRAVRRAAQALLDTRRPGDFNQAVMDLGATICKPRTPDCAHCPVARTCRAQALGTPERFPALPPRPKPIHILRAAAVIVTRGKVLVTERTESPNVGFLELPMLDVNDRDVNDRDLNDRAVDDRRNAPDGSRRLAAALALHLDSSHDLCISMGEALPVHRHSITRYRIAVHPFRGSLSSGRVTAPLLWASPTGTRPFTTATRRILAASLPGLFSTESS